jgi:hypothetical protein
MLYFKQNQQMNKKNKKGVALLIAIVIASILLSVGLSLSVLAVKDIGISSSVRDSMRAFYASESALDCAKFWVDYDIAQTDSALERLYSGRSITCKNESIVVSEGNTDFAESPERTFGFSINYGQYEGVAFGAYTRQNSDERDFYTFGSSGYSTTEVSSDRLVERQKTVLMEKLSPFTADVVLAYDTSVSLCIGKGGDNNRYCQQMYFDYHGYNPDDPADTSGGCNVVKFHNGDSEQEYNDCASFDTNLNLDENATTIEGFNFPYVTDGGRSGDIYAYSELWYVAQAVITFIDSITLDENGNQLSVVRFHDQIERITDLTADKNQLPPRGPKLDLKNGGTNTIGAIVEADNILTNTDPSRQTDDYGKILVMVTDGQPVHFLHSGDKDGDGQPDNENKNAYFTGDPDPRCESSSVDYDGDILKCHRVLSAIDTATIANNFKSKGYEIYTVYVNQELGDGEYAESFQCLEHETYQENFISNEDASKSSKYLEECIASSSIDGTQYHYSTQNFEELGDILDSVASGIELKLISVK